MWRTRGAGIVVVAVVVKLVFVAPPLLLLSHPLVLFTKAPAPPLPQLSALLPLPPPGYSTSVAVAAAISATVTALEERAGEDAVLAMGDAAAASTHAHRDGTTLMSYAGPGRGAVGGKVSQASSGGGGGGEWEEAGDVECAFGPTNLLVT